VLAFLVLSAVVLLAPSSVAADGGFGHPRETQIGTFGGIAYVQYDGIFEGQTSTGAYRVPYRITAPADPNRGNRTVVVEPPHSVAGLGALSQSLGPDFLFSRGFVHAGIGWSTASFGKGQDLRILDPAVRGVYIKGGLREHNGRTDDEIIADFGRALAGDSTAQRIIGRVDRRYITGFSESSEPVLRLITSGKAAGVFDFALPFTAEGHEPQDALAAGLFGGKLIIVNSEADAPAGLVDDGGLTNQYRYYAVAGTPHVPDFLGIPFFTTGSTPASFQPELRAHFLQGHDWVRGGAKPSPSTHLKALDDGTLDRDVNGNAISVDASGQPVARLPFVELGEAHFIAGFVGSYDNVKRIQDLGFEGPDAYVKAFEDKLANYVKAGYILKEDADAMRRRAALCPKTFTETYRDHYDAFTTIVPCGS
jgi:hypothetical protein